MPGPTTMRTLSIMHIHVDRYLYGMRWLAYTAAREYISIIPAERMMTGYFILSYRPAVCTSKYMNIEEAPMSRKPMAKILS